MNLRKLLIGSIVVLPFLLAGCYGQSDSAKPVPVIDGIQCSASEQLAFHIHPTLKLFKDGREQTVSANIGIKGGRCLYWLHTHDTSGLLHIESPSQRDYTLGNFLNVWGKPITDKSAAGMSIGTGQLVRAYVNGVLSEGDPATIKLVDGETISLQVGPPFAEPTATPAPSVTPQTSPTAAASPSASPAATGTP